MAETSAIVVEQPELRNCARVFEDREDAGHALARLIKPRHPRPMLLLAIPSGGVPVAAAIARDLGWPLDIAVTSKITPPWNSEVGYGAIAFDGTLRLNEPLCERLGLGRNEIEAGIARTREKVQQRVARLRRDRPPLALSGRPAMLVDDGLASGFTLEVAITAVRRLGASPLYIAVPTGHGEPVRRIAGEVDELYCANVRDGYSYAVADAYRHWSDVSDDKVVAELGNAWNEEASLRR
jgi:predicted phosphoribosyltransferase